MSKVSKLATIRAVGILGGGAIVLGAVACTSFGAEDPAAGPLDASVDGAPADGAPGDGGTSGENLIPNGDFETAGGECGQGWLATHAFNASFAPTTTSHRGRLACKICPNGGQITFFSFDPGAFRPKPGVSAQAGAQAGQSYEIRVWLRADDGGAAPLVATLYVRVRKPGGDGGAPKLACGAPSTLGTDYTFHSFAHTLTESGLLNVYIEFKYAPNVGCAIIDDFEVVELLP